MEINLVLGGERDIDLNRMRVGGRLLEGAINWLSVYPKQ